MVQLAQSKVAPFEAAQNVECVMKPNMTRTVPVPVPAVEPIMDDAAEKEAAEKAAMYVFLTSISAADGDRTTSYANVLSALCAMSVDTLRTDPAFAGLFLTGKQTDLTKTIKRVFGLNGLKAIKIVVASRAGWHSTLAGLIG